MSWGPTLRGLDARHFMETNSSRPGREHFLATLTLEPSHRAKGLSRPLTSHSLGLETCLSTNTEPCTNGCPFDHQSGERSCYTRYPHEDFIQTTPWILLTCSLQMSMPTDVRAWFFVAPNPASLGLDVRKKQSRGGDVQCDKARV